jgi:hypothetical protein
VKRKATTEKRSGGVQRRSLLSPTCHFHVHRHSLTNMKTVTVTPLHTLYLLIDKLEVVKRPAPIRGPAPHRSPELGSWEHNHDDDDFLSACMAVWRLRCAKYMLLVRYVDKCSYNTRIYSCSQNSEMTMLRVSRQTDHVLRRRVMHYTPNLLEYCRRSQTCCLASRRRGCCTAMLATKGPVSL